MRSRAAISFLLLFALTLSACDLLQSAGVGEAPATPAPTATPGATAEAPGLPAPGDVTTPTLQAQTLRIWLPRELVNSSGSPQGLFQEQFAVFNERYPELSIIVQEKVVAGPGGIITYLRTGRDVAPDVLPDVVVLPVDILPAVASEGLISPLDDQISAEALEDLFPSALQMARPEDLVLGYTFVLTGLPHLVYNTSAITGTLPLTWDALADDASRRLVFAADGLDGALMILQFYQDAGGQIFNEAGEIALDEPILVEALRQLQEGRDSGFIVEASSGFSTVEQSWASLLTGTANIARTAPEYYLTQNTALLPIGYTVTAGHDRPLTPLVSGWAWAASASDPAKHELAGELIESLVSAEVLGAWSAESNVLPARRAALATWTIDENYHEFVRQELERAQPMPVAPGSKLLTVLGEAVFQVVSGTMTSEEAASQAMTSLAP